ncbi:hypothetical protein DFQ26_000073 [Actinomortierella ambigua]|nr:hypothetical protein DFQ26_000073 [Actinomortierella ambigua]
MARLEPWPLEMTNYLLSVEYEALELEYYGPFNVILTHVFPFAEHYVVAPQAHPNRRDTVDYNQRVKYLILGPNHKAVGGVVINRASDIDDAGRRDAHRQALDSFRTLHDSVRVPVMVLISAIGRHCRVYRYTRASRVAVPAMGDSISREQWSIDLSTPQGRQQLNAAFNEIKANTQADL